MAWYRAEGVALQAMGMSENSMAVALQAQLEQTAIPNSLANNPNSTPAYNKHFSQIV